MIDIREARSSEIRAIADLYADAGYGAAVARDDTTVVATFCERLVGVVRLCPEEGVLVLRGMQIRSGFHRQGLGSRLLAACEPYLERRLAFCLPYSHLESFYAAVGFHVVSDKELPDFLEKRLSSYREKGKEVLAMRHKGAGP